MARLTAQALAPVTILAEFPNVIIVKPAVPAQNLRELLALARQRPGEITFGSVGNIQLMFKNLPTVPAAWFTIAAPGATPPPMLQRLNGDLRAVLAASALRVRFVTLGCTLAEPHAFPAAETAKWTRVGDAAGLRLD